MDHTIYYSDEAVTFQPLTRTDLISLTVLPFLVGLKWGEVPLAWIQSLCPIAVRVTDNPVREHEWVGHVTVHVDQDMIIEGVSLHTVVGLPDHVESVRSLLDETKRQLAYAGKATQTIGAW